jgi:hypothetical protein
MLRDLLHKCVFIIDAVAVGSTASSRHGQDIDALGEVNQVTSIHGQVFLSSAGQPILIEQEPAILRAAET